MYSEQDLQQIKDQLRRRSIFCGIPAVLLLAGVIVSVVSRAEVLTDVLSVLLGAWVIFACGLFISPVAAYKKHLESVLHGHTRTLTGAFKEMEENAVIRDGVRFYPLLLNVGEMDQEKDDRLFYYDAALPRPDWHEGEMITVVSHDKNLGSWERA